MIGAGASCLGKKPMWIVRLALQRPYTMVVMAILILIMGGLAIFRTPTDIFPNIDIPVVSIIWNFTGLVPKEMDDRILNVTSAYEPCERCRGPRAIGALARLSIRADELHREATRKHSLQSAFYKSKQSDLYHSALKMVATRPSRTEDD